MYMHGRHFLTNLAVFQKKQTAIVFPVAMQGHRDTDKQTMKKTMFGVLTGVLAMVAAQAQTVSASAADGPHFYVGVGIGAVKDSVSGDHKRTAKFFGGYEFDENWGVELGYSRLGKTGF
jgi:hypothetical protein